MDVLDVAPEEWPDSLARHFEGVLDNPVAWAQKCVNDYGAGAICLSMVSTDPNGINRPSAEAAKVAADVINSIDVPIIIWGCDNAEKDTETLRDITAMIGDKKVCLAPLTDANYRSIGATAMAFQHPVVAASPIDVNLAKQLNILMENLGMHLDTVLIDPSIGALGYGIEYSYSVMERIRLAALTQQDDKLQVPFICNLGREVWKAKEAKLPSDDLIGDQENRGVLMEAVTASMMLMAGGEVMIMRHPKSIALIKSLINGLTG
jgi:CO dehydrogenase/acetyl-CoA synthase delta subunit